MTFPRAGLTGPGYSHILSFRRQIFIHPDDESKIPESIQINFEDTSYWIFPSTDTIKCFVCKKVGHIAKNCQYKPDDLTGMTTSKDQKFIEKSVPNTNEELAQKNRQSILLEFPPLKGNLKDNPNTGQKRPHSDSASTISGSNTDGNPSKINSDVPKKDEKLPTVDKKSKKKPKKPKTGELQGAEKKEISKNTKELLIPIAKVIEGAKDKYILDFLQ